MTSAVLPLCFRALLAKAKRWFLIAWSLPPLRVLRLLVEASWRMLGGLRRRVGMLRDLPRHLVGLLRDLPRHPVSLL